MQPSLQLRRLLCYCYPTTVEAAAVVAEQGGVKEAEAEEHHVPPFLKNRELQAEYLCLCQVRWRVEVTILCTQTHWTGIKAA